MQVDVSGHRLPDRFTARVIEGGRVTIPKPIRLATGIERDDLVELRILAVHKRNRGVGSNDQV